MGALAHVMPSDSGFGTTDLGGLLARPVPLHGMLGDSQAALLAQGCVSPGSVKATYGTGSSVMMNVGGEPLRSTHGLVTSIAWDLGGARSYVLEGNLNYTGAVVSWLEDDVHLIGDAAETEVLVRSANPDDRSYFVPAFTGLGAPWWDSEATGLLTGVTRTTGRSEIVRACLDCIAYQVADVVDVMRQDTGLAVGELRVDGGPTRNRYLMQMQADVAEARVSASGLEELSAAGAAVLAGRATGLEGLEAGLGKAGRMEFEPSMEQGRRALLVDGWHAAVRQAMSHA
jgi:glycerol kinase